MAYKIIINRTDAAISGQLMLRKGSDPGSGNGDVKFSVDAGQTKKVEYGDPQNPYLNGVDAECKPEGTDLVGTSISVIKRGSPGDDKLNTRNTFTFMVDPTRNLVFSSSNT